MRPIVEPEAAQTIKAVPDKRLIAESDVQSPEKANHFCTGVLRRMCLPMPTQNGVPSAIPPNACQQTTQEIPELMELRAKIYKPRPEKATLQRPAAYKTRRLRLRAWVIDGESGFGVTKGYLPAHKRYERH